MILITGGAGYIGSHVVKEMALAGHDIVILDNLSTGHLAAVEAVKSLLDPHPHAGTIQLFIGDCGDEALLDTIFRQQSIEAVIHLAACSLVGESMIDPGKYFANNTGQAIHLLNIMVRHRVLRFVFSSSAAVYGEPVESPITEQHPTHPTNNYGLSKLMVEQMLPRYQDSHGLRYISLRYFNAAGADESGLMGEKHEPESHLVPLLIYRAMGKRGNFVIYGDDYNTPDGTCLRDYVHVSDLASAHRLALESLDRNTSSSVYNLGNGKPHSVLEVLAAVSQVAGHPIEYRVGQRRSGDPAVLLASASKAAQELGWQPRYASLQQIVKSAWAWHTSPHFSSTSFNH